MTVFKGTVDATFAAFGIGATYTPAGGEPVPVLVIASRPDTIVAFGETRIHAETATFEGRASEVASPCLAISSRLAARPSSYRVSWNGATPTGSCGALTVCHERMAALGSCGAVEKMGEGPPKSACRSRLQTASCCKGKELLW